MSDTPGRPPPAIATGSASASRIEDLHRWAVREGLRGASAADLFDEFCRRLVAVGVPLWRAFAGMRTLHPQWGGYTYTWWRDRKAIDPGRAERGARYEQDLQNSPFARLIGMARGTGSLADKPLQLRRRLAKGKTEREFPVLAALAAAGATDYVAELVPFRVVGDLFPENGIGYSFATDAEAGFAEDDLHLIEATLPVISLAIMSDAERAVAAGLLAAYLGDDAGRRVHAGAVGRGSVESIRAVLWYADIRGFTAIADVIPGAALVEMLNEVFETLTAALRPKGGQVLKFLGDGMLATFAFEEATQTETCRRALDAAAEAMLALDRLNAARASARKRVATVDLALHLGEVLYGNVGAVDRLDFTIIGPAVNEVARIESLCQPLGRSVLVSAALAAAAGDTSRLEPLGAYVLRGVREASEIYALRL